MSVLHSFLLLNNIPLFESTTFYLSIHQLMDIWVVSTLGFSFHLVYKERMPFQASLFFLLAF